MIPARLIRTIPADETDEMVAFWQTACELHPDWDHVTYQDPINPEWFPITSRYWPLAGSGAQLAGMIRLEALWHGGGFYLDSDLELFRPLDHLRQCSAVGTWEDSDCVPDWFIAAEPEHPAIRLCLDLAIVRIQNRDDHNWRTGCDAWGTGPGVTNTVLRGRDDVVLLAPAVLAPYHYTEPARAQDPHHVNPVCLGAHRWAHSWVGH